MEELFGGGYFALHYGDPAGQFEVRFQGRFWLKSPEKDCAFRKRKNPVTENVTGFFRC